MYYLSGPMRGYPDLNREAFEEAKKRWRADLGIDLLSPFDMMPEGENAETPVKEFMLRDLQALQTCRGIVMLPGWEASKGAVAEFFCARWLGLPAFDAESSGVIEFPFHPAYAGVSPSIVRQAGDEQADGYVAPSLGGPYVPLGLFEPEPRRHRGSARFHQLLKEIGDLHDRKQADYGTDSDPFANVRATTSWGVPAWTGALIRLHDKVVRLQSFARKGVLENESAMDSMLDIAVYALIAYVLYEESACPQEIPSAGYQRGFAESAMASALRRAE